MNQRIKQLVDSEIEGQCVLYVMSRDQRANDNHALLAAQKRALDKGLPLAVVFCLLEKSGFRAREHYEFMLHGLHSVEEDLKKLNIPFMMVIGSPKERLSGIIHHLKPDALFLDFNPLRGPRKLANELRMLKPCDLFVVDTHNIIPSWVLSDKKEVGAYTIRPKIHKTIASYLTEPDKLQKHPINWPGHVQTLSDLQPKINDVLQGITQNGTKQTFAAGEHVAAKQLEVFVGTKLQHYAAQRNDPAADMGSDLSPYLHFGQISSLRVALRLREEMRKEGRDLHLLSSWKMPKPGDNPTRFDGVDVLLEEMIVRKELSDNYCFYESHYDSIDAAPTWARTSLEKHATDQREYAYSYEEFAHARTHDPAWNAAQKQMTTTGKMAGYMRMYWAKKVLEWTESPEQAITFLIQLNDHYSIDGGDPNGYAGILWSVAGVHDRPWAERDIFGVVRYMNYGGLKRKFDIRAYENAWN